MDYTAEGLVAIGRISGALGGHYVNRVPANDRVYNCLANEEQGVLEALATISFSLSPGTLLLDGTLTAKATIGLTYVSGWVMSGMLSARGSLRGEFYIQYAKKNWVGWSKIGDARILIDQSNEAGYAPLKGDATGVIYKILALSERFPVVYGSKSINKMEPVSAPFATFGFAQLMAVGLLGPGCVCGDDTQHFFITSAKDLWKLTKDKGLEKLDYSEFIAKLTPNNEQIVMHYDVRNLQVYISSPIGGYTLTAQGLGGGIANLTALTESFAASPSTLVMVNQSVCTDTLDMGQPGIKTVQEVIVAGNGLEDVYVAVDYRYNSKDTFTTSPWILCNDEGTAFPIVSGTEFRFRFKTLTNKNFQVDYLSIRFKYSDKRFNRSATNLPIKGSN